MTVCSRHFSASDFLLPGHATQRRRLKRGVVPSQNLPVLSTENKEKRKRLREVSEGRQKRRDKRAAVEPLLAKVALCEAEKSCNQVDDNAESVEDHEDRAESAEDGESSTVPLPVASPVVLLDMGVQVSSGDFGENFSRVVNKENVCSFTGLPNMELLTVLEKLVSDTTPTSTRAYLSAKDKIVMTMMALKHALTFDFLSQIFGVCPTTVSTTVRKTTRVLAAFLKTAITWPSKDEVLHNLPVCFEKFSHVRVVLDCTEIPVGTPKCLRCRISTYFHYKKGHTIKYMVGVSPGGLVTYVSSGYGGRASDKAIFDQSGLVDMLLPGIDHIMVDKGFLIDSTCETRLIAVVRPPFLHAKKQLSKGEALATKRIAAARVHVERVTQRIKLLKIASQKMPWHMVPLADDILTIACALTNLSPQVLADSRFL
ncbi:uncharacterized protein LOC120838419 [Ixodes scapularis]|uniref:uncharacterized protein LOC120838419 n=1 Tax=Ixodes scapularis TaxID=6945 RepID=UPI001C387B22|nr:uncharacterized protein LOC120838419 [Ixodes scapularis]